MGNSDKRHLSENTSTLVSSEIPIYVISLADEKSRKDFLKSQFTDYFDKFLFVEAIDFRRKALNDIRGLYKQCVHNRKQPLTPTEIACSLSHVKALKQFLETSHKRCMILEDDILGRDADIDFLLEVMQPIRHGLFLLGGQEGMKNSKYLCGYKNNAYFYSIPELARIFLYRTCCYSVDRYWAQRIIEEQDTCLKRADDWHHLTKSRKDIFLLKVLKHPVELNNSYIQAERSLLRDNFASLVYRNTIKIYLSLLVMLNKFNKI
ncbi:glycosyltransferase family 25 protein [Acinetobacter radioresistens]|uniref:glycosyltransferase family 25 protein n=1 Tax=Acinetobacter radioresistens TaxID=40216 RepID=UPI00254B1FA6|nr:glycosyltransferase family 25 protein [Acinetobacter radioresistens]MDK8755543.1 glycosyltransferase family 25 protein [Acinetobacter radioresistens]